MFHPGVGAGAGERGRGMGGKEAMGCFRQQDTRVRTRSPMGWPPRVWTQLHGYFPPTATAVGNDYPMGKWAKNKLDAAKLDDQIPAWREAQERVESAAGYSPTHGTSSWTTSIPAWGADRWRCLRLVQVHLAGGGSLPTKAAEVVVQGEDLADGG